MSNVIQYRRTETEQQPQQPARSTPTRTTTSTSVKKSQEMEIRLSVENLRQLYADCIGSPMPMAIHRRVLLELQDGAPFEYYRYALEEAAAAPRPSWRYVQAIVARLYREQVPPETLIPWIGIL